MVIVAKIFEVKEPLDFSLTARKLKDFREEVPYEQRYGAEMQTKAGMRVKRKAYQRAFPGFKSTEILSNLLERGAFYRSSQKKKFIGVACLVAKEITDRIGGLDVVRAFRPTS